MTFTRYAIYYCPPANADWAEFCAAWLGWDMLTSVFLPHPELAALPLPIAKITQAPRKYGLHATLKPPFRLTDGKTQTDLEAACAALANTQPPVQVQALDLIRLGRFLALCADGQTYDLNALAARCVRELDGFRAPMTDAELVRRQGTGLSEQRHQNLVNWGYPHVMELFRFHITLTGRLPKDALPKIELALKDRLSLMLPSPLTIRDLALAGEDAAGRFHLIQRYPFMG